MLQDRRYKAMLGTDVATVSDMLSDDLIYSYSLGDRDSAMVWASSSP
jgi:hypothetical protein